MRPSRTAASSQGRNKGKAEISGARNEGDRIVEILKIDPSSVSSDNGSIRYTSPFVPDVGGTRSFDMSGYIRSAQNGSTPFGQKSPASKESKCRNRREELELERTAAPEKDLTLFALRLAVLEKLASNVGTLGFIWATVVILGGYAVTLKEIDFWFVTVILVTEGARIFSRSHELEWQHMDTGTASTITRAYQIGSDAFFRSTRVVRRALSSLVSPGAGGSKILEISDGMDLDSGTINHQFTRLRRTWSSSRVPLVPFMRWIFRAKHISKLLYWMQLVSAMLSIGLSVYRLRKHDFIKASETDTQSNHASALFMFYSLTAFEALVFLFERTYWQYEISVKKLLVQVNRRCGLSKDDMGTTRRFFYDVYAKCLTESIFEGVKMDLVDYSLAWLQSDIATEQLGGLRVLLTFSSNSEYSEETLRTVGVRQGAVERLLDMVTWKNLDEYEIRSTAGQLLTKLVKYNRNSIRMAAIPGAIEGIFGLLTHEASAVEDAGPDSRAYIQQRGSAPIAAKNVANHIVGLRILKNLAKDPLNCAKIGTTRGLLATVISFTDTTHQMLRNAEEPEQRVMLVKKALELLNLLAGATGFSGKMLRQDISKVVYTIPNLRNILEYGELHMLLQELAAEILLSLAMDDEVREMIGRTGGVMRNLMGLLLKERVEGDRKQVRLAMKAGEVLTLLAFKNEQNCLRILRLRVKEGGRVVQEEEEEEGDGEEEDVVGALIGLVGNWELGDVATTLLRSFFAYIQDPHHNTCKARIAASTPEVLKVVMERLGRSQEAALGLAAKTVAGLTPQELEDIFAAAAAGDDASPTASLTTEGLVARLAKVLDRHPSPSTQLPRVRRFCLELAIALAQRGGAPFLSAFRAHNFRYLLRRVADSVSELENYATFSGAIGITPHSVPMIDLVEDALANLRLQPRSAYSRR